MSSFWFKVKGMWLLLSLEHSEDVAELLNGLTSGLLCLGTGRPEERGRERGMAHGGATSTHTFIHCLPSYVAVIYGAPK